MFPNWLGLYFKWLLEGGGADGKAVGNWAVTALYSEIDGAMVSGLEQFWAINHRQEYPGYQYGCLQNHLVVLQVDAIVWWHGGLDTEDQLRKDEDCKDIAMAAHSIQSETQLNDCSPASCFDTYTIDLSFFLFPMFFNFWRSGIHRL